MRVTEEGMTRRGTALIAACALGLGLVAVAPPAGAATTKFTSCAKMLKVYPHGISKSTAAANRAVRNGQYRPAVRPTVYANSYKTLDRDKDGSMCEQPR
jgi:hypothetical protein